MASSKELSKEQLHHLVSEAHDFALIQGIGMRPSPLSQSKMTTAPLTLLPSPFDADAFRKTSELQKELNLLMVKVAFDDDFLTQVLADTIEVDEFTRNVYRVYKTARKEGLAQSLSLGLFRSDYFYCTEAKQPKQVEFNTIASSFGCLTTRLVQLHKSIMQVDWVTRGMHAASFITVGIFIITICRHTLGLLGRQKDSSKVLESKTLPEFASALKTAWQLYDSADACVLFLVEDHTANICDQRMLEYELIRQQPKLKVLRRTIQQVAQQGKMDEKSRIFTIDNTEVAVVYMRAGYDPEHYKNQADWDARLMMEKSRTIMCPSAHFHLAGTKKVQQELSKPNVLKRFIEDDQTRERIQALFTGLYSLDHNEEGNASFDLALSEPQRFVLKPQREGGGNNVYGLDIKPFLEPLKDSKERSAYILMDLIKPPRTQNYVIRGDNEVKLTEVVSELGIFGTIIASEESIKMNRFCGQMLRTKSSSENEGGVAAGSGYLDTVMIVEGINN